LLGIYLCISVSPPLAAGVDQLGIPPETVKTCDALPIPNLAGVLALDA